MMTKLHPAANSRSTAADVSLALLLGLEHFSCWSEGVVTRERAVVVWRSRRGWRTEGGGVIDRGMYAPSLPDGWPQVYRKHDVWNGWQELLLEGRVGFA